MCKVWFEHIRSREWNAPYSLPPLQGNWTTTAWCGPERATSEEKKGRRGGGKVPGFGSHEIFIKVRAVPAIWGSQGVCSSAEWKSTRECALLRLGQRETENLKGRVCIAFNKQHNKIKFFRKKFFCSFKQDEFLFLWPAYLSTWGQCVVYCICIWK